MIVGCALLILVLFVFLAHRLRVTTFAGEVMQRSSAALADLRNADLDDEAKERAVRGHALRLMLLFLIVTLLAGVALGVPIGFVALLEMAGLVELEAVLIFTVTWEFLVGTSLLAVALVWLVRRRQRGLEE